MLHASEDWARPDTLHSYQPPCLPASPCAAARRGGRHVKDPSDPQTFKRIEGKLCAPPT